MPRPTPAQLAAGFPTVVLSTLAMLLLSGVSSGPGVVAVAAAGLVLGLLAAAAVTLRGARRSAGSPARAATVPVPRPRAVGGGAEARVGEHSLRR